MYLTQIWQELHKKAYARHRVIEPLPGKTWMDCLDIQAMAGYALFHYHIPGDKSSKAVYIKLEEDNVSDNRTRKGYA